jgi:serine/threonine-protein kinase
VEFSDSIPIFVEEPGFPRFGDLHVVERIGAGGMAEVFRAVGLNREGRPMEVAVKRLLPSLVSDPEVASMFRAEAQLAMKLDHPNLVHVHARGSSTHGEYLIMEYLDGVDLVKLIQRRGALPWRSAMTIGLYLARALAHVHAARGDDGNPLYLAHRDVSPANAMITRDGRVKLLDFGIAKALAARSHATRIGQIKGKLGYMAPEQLMGHPVDQRIDQFALGVTLYELCWGRRLFPKNELRQALESRKRIPLPLQIRVPHIPPWACVLVQQLLRPDREDRFPSMESVVRLLEKWLDPSPRAGELAALLRDGPREPGRDTAEIVLN